MPLVDYEGGGPAAMFEPLAQHLPEFEMALAQNLGAGIAACYRGTQVSYVALTWAHVSNVPQHERSDDHDVPLQRQIYDTPATLAVVAKWTTIYKKVRFAFYTAIECRIGS